MNSLPVGGLLGKCGYIPHCEQKFEKYQKWILFLLTVNQIIIQRDHRMEEIIPNTTICAVKLWTLTHNFNQILH